MLKANLVNATHYVPKAVLTEFKQAIQAQATEVAAQVAINQSTAIQFRMNLGQTYTPSLDLSFDMGVPGVNLSLAGGIGLTLNWDLYLGFGVGLTDGFYVVTNMPGNAGIGQVTTYSAVPAKKGVATGVADNDHDAYIDNLWLVGKPGQTAAVKELQATVDVYSRPGRRQHPGPARRAAVLPERHDDRQLGWLDSRQRHGHLGQRHRLHGPSARPAFRQLRSHHLDVRRRQRRQREKELWKRLPGISLLQPAPTERTIIMTTHFCDKNGEALLLKRGDVEAAFGWHNFWQPVIPAELVDRAHESN